MKPGLVKNCHKGQSRDNTAIAAPIRTAAQLPSIDDPAFPCDNSQLRLCAMDWEEFALPADHGLKSSAGFARRRPRPATAAPASSDISAIRHPLDPTGASTGASSR